MKLGSLFDGSGGFPLAGSLCGIEPAWAAEVEPYPIAVTSSRFPKMRHLGSVTDIHGGKVEPVDIITFGSPCQDLSVAGKRAGLKHEANGDEETTRSGLFMEAVRIIKEMREATNGRYPTFAVWENVPGAFSSNQGEDFRIVLEELIKIAEPTAVMPAVPKGGWAYADSYCGDGWSLAYRVFDAQYWGVPQRRRRIYLVADFRGERAREVLFEREGLRGYFATGRTPWQGVADHAEGSVGADDREGNCLTPRDVQSRRIFTADGAWPSLYSGEGGGHGYVVCVGADDREGAVGLDCYNQSLTGDKAKALTNAATDSDHIPCVAYGFPLGFRPENVRVYEEVGTTLCNGTRPGFTTEVVVARPEEDNRKGAIGLDGYNATTTGDVSSTLGVNCGMSTGRNGVIAVHLIQDPITNRKVTPCLTQGNSDRGQAAIGVAYGQPIAIDRAFFNQGQNAQYEPQFYEDGTVSTLVARGPSAVAYSETYQKVTGPLMANSHPGSYTGQDAYNDMFVVGKENIRYIVRRLTPTECARLQGFPDKWGHPDHKEDFADEEWTFWAGIRNTHAAINGKATKSYTREQMVKWYNGLHTDSAEYKMWGNGIALPCARYVMEGIAEVARGELMA